MPPLAASLKPIERLVNDEYVPFLLNLFFRSCFEVGVSDVSLPKLEPV